MTEPIWVLGCMLVGIWGTFAAAALWLRRRDRRQAAARKQERRRAAEDAWLATDEGERWHAQHTAAERTP